MKTRIHNVINANVTTFGPWLLRLTLFLTFSAFLSVHFSSISLSQDIDMEEIFRCSPSAEIGPEECSEARDLILNSCTLCHAFVPIVLQQFDRSGWDGLFDRHADRSPELSADQIEDMKSYLAANFNPSIDPPDLPTYLLDLWTSY
tara:strand:+ start:345 stop:782 length:438 start_codon:yes stop_codon:yes gene_type:complete